MKQKKAFSAFCLLVSFVLLIGLFSTATIGKKLIAETNTKSCADIVFGTTEISSSPTPTTSSFKAHGLTVASISQTSCYCAASQSGLVTDNSMRIGKSGGAGTITFTFSSVRITSAKVLVYKYSTDASKTATCTVTTSALTSAVGQTVSATAAPDISDSSTDAGLVFTGLDNGGQNSTTLTISGTSTARFNLCKIVLTINGSSSESSSATSSAESSAGTSEITSTTSTEAGAAPITFNFVEQGNQYSGDCTYIKAGDYDILIDAGNRTSCASTIETYLEDSSRTGNYVSDGKLEYVIATHAHQDHIAGFVGVSDSSSAGMNGVLYHYNVGTLIDFALANTTSTIYTNYQTARTYAVNQGTKHFTALQCWNNEGNGAARSYQLGTNLKMDILYNYYYENSGSDENNYSVCVLFTQGSKHFLFTGDLEADGESRLVANNTLPEVELFKGGHHGSYTANTDALLSVIKPKMVCICCCAGNKEYASTTDHSFPAQESINRIAPYTDRVYVTTLGQWDSSTYHTPMNGNIVVAYDASSNETLICSNNTTKLKDTAWFIANRTMPSAWSA
jgi:beta-lactamase superfamily II metal-dependent hydrolase